MRAWFRFSAAIAALSLLAVPASADEEAKSSVDASAAKVPWRGSSVSYGQEITARSFFESAQLTWDPAYTHSLTLAPQWHFDGLLTLAADLSLEQELTTSNYTTYQHEVMLSDLGIRLIPDATWKESNTDVVVSGDLRLTLPVSKASRAATLNAGLTPTVRLSRKFDLLKGFVVGYSGSATINSHRYTTTRYRGNQILNCRGSGCDAFGSSDDRNVQWGLAHGPFVSLSPTTDLKLGASMGWRYAHLYDVGSNGYGLENDGTNFRIGQSFRLGASYALTEYLGLDAGIFTGSPQLALNSTYQNPFLNRFTQFFAGASVDIDAFLNRK